MGILIKALWMGTEAIQNLEDDAHLLVTVTPEDDRKDTNQITSTLKKIDFEQSSHPGYQWTIPD